MQEDDEDRPEGNGPDGNTGLHDLGVLFVHGIGTQRRGETLSRCTGALYRWLEKWFSGSATAWLQPRLSDAWLVAEDAGTGGPARCRLRLKEGSRTRESWLMAESHWADTFHAVPYHQMLAWALVSVPRTVFLHAINPALSLRLALELATPGRTAGSVDADRSVELTGPDIALRAFAGAAMLVLSPLLIAMVMVTLVLLFFLGLLPLDASRNAALYLQSKLAQTLGDSFLFADNPVTEAAIVTRVQSDLLWLAPRCRRVVVVAHSQGAAVSYRALVGLTRDHCLPGVPMEFVTYGSGLRKLADLSRGRQRRLALFGWCSALLASALWYCLWQLLLQSSALALTGVALLFCLLLLLVTLGSVALPRPKEETPLAMDWFDFYATRDPVPNGRVDVRFWGATAATGSGRQLAGGLPYRRESLPVTNRHSLISDHSTYWDAADDFTARIAQRLLADSETAALDEAQRGHLQATATARRRRLWQLAGLRLAAMIAWATQLLWNGEAVAALGQSIGGRLPSDLDELWPWRWLPDTLAVNTIPSLALGAVALAGLLALLYTGGRFGSRLWGDAATCAFFRGTTARKSNPGFWLFLVAWLAVIAAPQLVLAASSPSDLSALPVVAGISWLLLRFWPGAQTWERVVPPPRPPG